MKIWGKIRVIPLLAAAAMLFVSFKFPMWEIYLEANMYPNDIGMAIYATHPGDPPDVAEMDGGLHELNVLNHYIGMRPIKADLPVFKILPVWIVVLGILLILCAFIRKLKLMLTTVILFALMSVYGVATLIYRIYSYGHNLRPDAAIKVPPFMPGIWGQNKLAQFTTYSYFDWGTYFLVIAFVVAFLVLVVDWRIQKRQAGEGMTEQSA